MDFEEKLIENLKEIGVNINYNKANEFSIYMQILLEWNEKMNLTAIVEKNDILQKHFVDSLTALKYINQEDKIIDVGTGAGFPGIPIKIVKEDTKITLMDSLNKRITFLQEVITKLNLNNITTIHSRAEDLAKDIRYREKYDIAISRAVANLSTLVEYMLPFVKVGGKCLCMKGNNIDEEVINAQKAIKELGGKIINIENFRLPNSDIERNIIIIKKIHSTPAKYPRKSGVPAKEPIK